MEHQCYTTDPPRGLQSLRASGTQNSSPDPSTMVLPTTSQLFSSSAFLGNWQRSARGVQGKEVCKKPAQIPPPTYLSSLRDPLSLPEGQALPEPATQTATSTEQVGITGSYRKRKKKK